MRRFTALLLAALMLLSLAACGQGASAGGSAQNAPDSGRGGPGVAGAGTL